MSTHTTLTFDLSHAPLPRGLREHAQDMTWELFLANYGDSAGRWELLDWECPDARRQGPQARRYHATVRTGDQVSAWSAPASGPIAALTAMFYERGIAVEMLNFHQLRMGRDIVTFIRGTDGARSEWAMAWAEDGTRSALRAVIACVNRLAD